MRISDTNVADFGKSEIVEVINTYADNMGLDCASSYVHTHISGNKPSNPLEWSILFDPISIAPNSFIEYVFIRRKREYDYSELPEKIFMFIAYDGNYANGDIEKVQAAMKAITQKHRIYSLYFNSALFALDMSLQFIPDTLWKITSDILGHQPCNKFNYKEHYVRVHRNVVSKDM